jgi:predicted TIM-barrel fold metal-dependent hydrolase
MDSLDSDFSAALCRAYNNWLADYCKIAPARLKGVALVSLQDIDQAVAEVRRAVAELGVVGISIHPDPAKARLLYDREVDPLWAEIERLNVAVGIHGTSTGMAEDDMARKFLHHPAGRVVQRSLVFPFQQMSAMAGILASGVCQRFPSLRIAFLEGNCSWLPWFLFRLDEQWEKHGALVLNRPPSEYFKLNCYISVDVDEYLVEDVIHRLGDDNLILSTDYPHYDSSFPEAIDTFLKLNLPDETRRKILWGNCARLYGMG